MEVTSLTDLELKRLRNRLYQKKYKQSKKGKLTEQRYRKSLKGALTDLRYKKSAKGKLAELKYRNSYKYKLKAIRNAKNRAKQIKLATPKWANIALIKKFYKERPKDKHVDHIVPLLGKDVCGLHVEYNLQYIDKIQNIKKGNKNV